MNILRSRMTLITTAVLVGVAAAGCGGSSSSSSGGSSGTTKPLVVGISLSSSGDFSDPGHAAALGYKLWADQVNKEGGILGRQVQLKIVDDASSPNQVVTNYQTLITRDKVDLVFGPFSTLRPHPPRGWRRGTATHSRSRREAARWCSSRSSATSSSYSRRRS